MKLKRILSLLIALTMIFSCVGLSAMAEENTVVAKVGNTEYTSVLAALQAAIDADASEVEILSDTREAMTKDFEIVIDNDLTITAAKAVKVEFYNNNTTFDFVVGSNNNNKLTIAENVHFDLVDRVIWLGYYGNNVDVQVDGYLGGYQIWHGADTTVSATGTLDSHGEAFIMRRDAILTVNGGNVNANYFQIYSGHIDAKDATITAGQFWVDNNHDYGVEGTVSVNLDNTDLDVTYDARVYAGEEKIVDINLTNGSTFDVNENMTVGTSVVVAADATSTVKAKNEVSVEKIPVAEVNGTSYTSFDEALAAANKMSGDVTVEIYSKVTLNKSLEGSYSSIKFVGKTDSAEIYLDFQGYITATSKTVSFESLKLSKSAGGFIDNAGFMNTAFGVYLATSVNYTDCYFVNGAYASKGTNTFTNCTFMRSHDKYGLWAYGDVDAIVDGCTFADYRGIKAYAEGAAKTVNLTVKNTDFSAVNDKPAIVLTYGESVTLEKNTYSDTGVFELDLDGAPNGTTITSDVAPTCKNDDGACGVLVDGKIYTTVAQAAAVATANSNVTLLHNSNETVEFAEGVVLNKNGFEAAGVTVKVNAVAKIGDKEYTTLAEALAEAKDGDTIQLMPGEFEMGSVKFPVTLKNITIKGAENKATIIKNSSMGSFDGSTVSYDGITFDGIVFDNSQIVFTGARGGEVIYKDWTITNCEFKNITSTANAAVHFNLNADETFENLTFTNNVIKGVSGGNVSGLRANYLSGNVTITGNDIANVAWNAVQIINSATNIFTVEDNIFAASASEGILNLANVTATEKLKIAENQFLVAGGQPGICYLPSGDVSRNYWGGSAPANLPEGITYKNYYTEIDDNGNLDRLIAVEGAALPDAEVTNLGKISVESATGDYTFGDFYYVFDLLGNQQEKLKKETTPFEMSLAMQFKSKDSKEEAADNAYAEYTTDFFIKIDGLSGDSFVGNGCYLAGYYPSFGAWVKIPLDGFTIEDGVVYPVISSAGFDFSYVDICTSVEDFICGIYLTPEILEGNPNISVNLTLGLSESLEKAQNAEFVKVDDYTYTAEDFKELIELVGTNLALDNTLAINFFYNCSDLKGTDYYAMISHDTPDGEEISKIEYSSWIKSGDRWKIVYSGIAAKQMSDVVEITIYDSEGKQVSKTDSESLRGYAVAYFDMHKNDISNNLWRTAMADMLNYGAAAQKFFGYRENDLANNIEGSYIEDYASQGVNPTGEYKSSESHAAGTTLVLSDRIELKAIFTDITDGMYAEITYTDHYGDYVEPYRAEIRKNEGGKYFEVVADTLVIADGKQNVKFTVYNSDGTVFAWIEDSINEYLAFMMNRPNSDPLYEMTAKFTKSAYDALHQNDK